MLITNQTTRRDRVMNKNKIDTTKLPAIDKLLRMDPTSCYDYLKKNRCNLVITESKNINSGELSFNGEKWGAAIPEPYYYGLLSFLYKRVTFWRDSHGRKSQFIGWD